MQHLCAEKIASGEYDQYIYDCANYVAAKCAPGNVCRRELVSEYAAELRAEALVAAERYSPDHQASFFTFLHKHLEHAKRRLIAKSWSRSRYPHRNGFSHGVVLDRLPAKCVDRSMRDMLMDARPRLSPTSMEVADAILAKEWPRARSSRSAMRRKAVQKLKQELTKIYAR